MRIFSHDRSCILQFLYSALHVRRTSFRVFRDTKMPNTNSSSDADDTQNNLVILLDHPEYEYVEIELIPTDNVPAQTTLTAAQLAAFLLALVLMGNPDE